MKPVLIKFLDPILVKSSKFTEKLHKPKEIEVIGYPVKETKDYLFLAASIADGEYKVVYDIPKVNIVKKITKDKNIYELKHTDMRVKYGRVRNFESHKPLEVRLCGFKMGENENTVWVASERNQEGKFRSVHVVPKGLIEEQDKK